MKKFVIARQSDHLRRIAFHHGMSFEEILALNPKLQERQEPDLLEAGDIIQIRQAERPKLTVESGAVNRFVAKIPTNKLKVLITDGDKPLANEPVEVRAPTLGGKFPKKTDASGNLELELPIYATVAHVFLPNRWKALRFEVGSLDPIEGKHGVRQRLANLGHQQTILESSVANWQQACGAEANGNVDSSTKNKINLASME